ENQRRLDSLLDWKIKANIFADSDNLGAVLSKTIDMIITITREGPENAFLLQDPVMILNRELAVEIEKRANKNDTRRHLFYGICECVSLMFESLIERKRHGSETIDLKEEPFDVEPNVHLKASSVVKEEPFDYDSSINSNDSFQRAVRDELENELIKEEIGDDSMSGYGTSVVKKKADDDFQMGRRTSTPHLVALLESSPHAPTPMFASSSASAAMISAAAQARAAYATTASTSAAAPAAVAPAAPVLASAALRKCGICSQVLPGDLAFVQHINQFHSSRKTAKKTAKLSKNEHHRCSICLKACPSAKELEAHSRTHESGQRAPQKCKLCAKTVRTASELAIHMRTHTGEKPFSCPQCERKFGCQSEVKRHLRATHKVQPHACKFCGQRFDKAQEVRDHLREFQCPKQEM
ncbi:hypothetical protein PENTCL1PPCAC_1088, partial [Pristionchus entomophagus]